MARFLDGRRLRVLTMAKQDGLLTKSNLILGMGEERAEVSQALRSRFQLESATLAAASWVQKSTVLSANPVPFQYRVSIGTGKLSSSEPWAFDSTS